jgi:hypothetical protein
MLTGAYMMIIGAPVLNKFGHIWMNFLSFFNLLTVHTMEILERNYAKGYNHSAMGDLIQSIVYCVV